MRDDFSRRVFLKTSSMAGAAVAFAEEARAAVRATFAPAPSWVDRPMRWTQLTRMGYPLRTRMRLSA
jgi:hypothetical protein